MHSGEIARHDREKIARLLEGIAPDREMPARARFAPGFQIAVGEQDGRFRLVRLEAHAIDREHIRPIQEIGDAAEALGLALRAIGRAGTVEPHQLGVGGRVEPGLDAQSERAARRSGDGEFVRRGDIGGGGERRAVESEADEIEFVAVEPRARPRAGLRDGGEAKASSITRVAWRSSEISISTESIRKSGTR